MAHEQSPALEGIQRATAASRERHIQKDATFGDAAAARVSSHADAAGPLGPRSGLLVPSPVPGLVPSAFHALGGGRAAAFCCSQQLLASIIHL